MSPIKSKCPHCLRSIELRDGKMPPHMNQGKLCQPRMAPPPAVGQYRGYKKVP